MLYPSGIYIIRRTWFDLVEEGDISILGRFTFACDVSYDMEVLDMWQLLVQCRQFVEMGRK